MNGPPILFNERTVINQNKIHSFSESTNFFYNSTIIISEMLMVILTYVEFYLSLYCAIEYHEASLSKRSLTRIVFSFP